MVIRIAQESDIPALAALYAGAVRAIAAAAYTPEQIEVWARFGANTPAFRQFILEATTYLWEENGEILGFAGLEENGHVTSLYVHANHQRRGIGSQLLQHLLQVAQSQQISRLYVEVSAFSRPVFEAFGFQLYDVEVIDRNGVTFERPLLEKWLASHESSELGAG
jgi:putative acetyltransferase